MHWLNATQELVAYLAWPSVPWMRRPSFPVSTSSFDRGPLRTPLASAVANHPRYFLRRYERACQYWQGFSPRLAPGLARTVFPPVSPKIPIAHTRLDEHSVMFSAVLKHHIAWDAGGYVWLNEVSSPRESDFEGRI